jgi:hypothetical protein
VPLPAETVKCHLPNSRHTCFFANEFLCAFMMAIYCDDRHLGIGVESGDELRLFVWKEEQSND